MRVLGKRLRTSVRFWKAGRREIAAVHPGKAKPILHRARRLGRGRRCWERRRRSTALRRAALRRTRRGCTRTRAGARRITRAPLRADGLRCGRRPLRLRRRRGGSGTARREQQSQGEGTHAGRHQPLLGLAGIPLGSYFDCAVSQASRFRDPDPPPIAQISSDKSFPPLPIKL